MKKLFFGAAAMLALASCSSENTLDLNNSGNEIAFSVATNNTSRAADVYCNNNKPGEFNVWASHDSKQYIAGDLIKFEGGKWVNKSGNRYWPSTGDVTFVAYENENGDFAFNPTGASNLTNFTVPTDVANQLDFIYARKTQAKASGTQVNLNFRHALSQIVYKAKNTNKNLFVEIGVVSIVNVNSKADFAFPTADTTTPYVDHGSTGDATIENQGVWSNRSTLTTFPVSFTNKKVAGNSAPVDLTAANDPTKEFSSLALLLIPQTTTAWDPSSVTKPTDETTDTYFVLSGKIRNVRDTTIGVQDDDVYLYGSASDYALIYIPVALNWAQGKKYVYTFTFGDGTAGYDPDGDHVLVPITFDVTVDDFKLGGEHDVNMD